MKSVKLSKKIPIMLKIIVLIIIDKIIAIEKIIKPLLIVYRKSKMQITTTNTKIPARITKAIIKTLKKEKIKNVVEI